MASWDTWVIVKRNTCAFPPVRSQNVCHETGSAPQQQGIWKWCVFFLQLLCLVGEAFDDHSDDVCGAVINIRAKGDKIAIWTTDYENKEAITHIG